MWMAGKPGGGAEAWIIVREAICREKCFGGISPSRLSARGRAGVVGGGSQPGWGLGFNALPFSVIPMQSTDRDRFD